MPPVPSKNSSLDGDADAQKRNRRSGSASKMASCAECRRLKVKCDRKTPCSSCLKRGCGGICPTGTLVTGEGHRAFWASTQELRSKLSLVSERVRSLEDALRVSQSAHPLLRPELLQIKDPFLQDGPSGGASSVKHEDDEDAHILVDTPGTLSVHDSGRTEYFGHAANPWRFLQRNESFGDLDSQRQNVADILPPEVAAASDSLLFLTMPPSSASSSNRLLSLYRCLPCAERANSLRCMYFDHSSWFIAPISQDEFNTSVYPQAYGNVASLESAEPVAAHRLSITFMVMAIGSLMDPSTPHNEAEADKYYQLAAAALQAFGCRTVDEPTVEAIQALLLVSLYFWYLQLRGSVNNVSSTVLGLVVKMSQTMGLHRDPRSFGLDKFEAVRRRRLFYELYVSDSWPAISQCRPPTICNAHVDVQPPFTENPPVEDVFHAWKSGFTFDILSVLHDQAFSASSTSFATVTELDQKVRAYPVPLALQLPGFGTSPVNSGQYAETQTLVLQRHACLVLRESVLISLHRGFLARAASDCPEDPLSSPYGASVLASYRSSWTLVSAIKNLNAHLKHPTGCNWFFWTNLYLAAVILGSITVHCPSLALAASALAQLDSACELFAGNPSGYCRKSLTALRKIQAEARLTLTNFKEGRLPLPRRGSSSTSASASSDEDSEDAHSRFGGEAEFFPGTQLTMEPKSYATQAHATGVGAGLPDTSMLTLPPHLDLDVNPMAEEFMHLNDYLPLLAETVPQPHAQHFTFSDAQMHWDGRTDFEQPPSDWDRFLCNFS